MSILENEHIRISTNSEGAELTSIFSKGHKLEYLWNANPSFWGRHAPVLFPIVGKLFDNQYKINGKTYELSQHGFARDFNFNLVEEKENEVIYELSSDERTLNKYPFNFLLRIKYLIEKDTVHVTYEVTNKDSISMPFSIGAHPAFNVPMLDGESFDDYYIQFDVEETLETIKLKGAYRDGKRELIAENTTIIPLTRDLFKDDALILEGLNKNAITICSKNHQNYVKVEFNGFPYVGIWTTQTAPFVCIEPWYGIADEQGEVKEMKDRLGIQTLEPNETFNCSFSISVGTN